MQQYVSGLILHVLRKGLILVDHEAKSTGHEEWEAMTQLVNRLSTVILDRLPDFWRIAKGHMEGKYSKVRICMALT